MLANPDGAVYAPGAYMLALGSLQAVDRVTESFRTGAGMGWHEHDDEVFLGCEQFFRPGYHANLVPAWLPALDGVGAKLRSGARVADVGCGLGASTILLAEEYQQAQLMGCDYHEGSIELARKRAADAGVAERIDFEVATAQDFPGTGYDLVSTFDCLHDMGDPVGAARHIRQSLADDGTWLIVEPFAGDAVTDNLNPVGRVYYGFSTFLCVPNALSQAGGHSLGAQAGEAAIGEGCRRGRLHPVPARRRDAVQPGLRGPALIRDALRGRARDSGSRARPRTRPLRGTPCGRASVSTTRCTATARSRCCCSRPGRSSTLGYGSCRCPTSPGTARVVVYDARGNGRSDRPTSPAAYDDARAGRRRGGRPGRGRGAGRGGGRSVDGGAGAADARGRPPGAGAAEPCSSVRR